MQQEIIPVSSGSRLSVVARGVDLRIVVLQKKNARGAIKAPLKSCCGW